MLQPLIEISVAVKIGGESVAEGRVADIEAGAPGGGEYVSVPSGAAPRFGDPAVDEVEVGEGDGEALGSKFNGEADEGDDVAL